MNISKKCDYESNSTLKTIVSKIKYLAYHEPANPETERHLLATLFLLLLTGSGVQDSSLEDTQGACEF